MLSAFALIASPAVFNAPTTVLAVVPLVKPSYKEDVNFSENESALLGATLISQPNWSCFILNPTSPTNCVNAPAETDLPAFPAALTSLYIYFEVSAAIMLSEMLLLITASALAAEYTVSSVEAKLLVVVTILDLANFSTSNSCKAPAKLVAAMLLPLPSAVAAAVKAVWS